MAQKDKGLTPMMKQFFSMKMKRHVPPMATCRTSIGNWDETSKPSNIPILMAQGSTRISIRT